MGINTKELEKFFAPMGIEIGMGPVTLGFGSCETRLTRFWARKNGLYARSAPLYTDGDIQPLYVYMGRSSKDYIEDLKWSGADPFREWSTREVADLLAEGAEGQFLKGTDLKYNDQSSSVEEQFHPVV